VADEPARSAAVVASPPHHTDDLTREWFCPAPATNGPGSGRRPLRVGDHIAADHPLVNEHPTYFAPSAEPVDAWPISVPSAEARKRQQAELLRLAAHPARKVTPVCARCGASSRRSVVMHDRPTQLALISELSGLDPHTPESRRERWAIEQRFAAMARAVADQERDLAEAEAAWRAEHLTCPEGTPELPAPQVPVDVPLFYRLGSIRGVG
jgi:hypothetical protein